MGKQGQTMKHYEQQWNAITQQWKIMNNNEQTMRIDGNT